MGKIKTIRGNYGESKFISDYIMKNKLNTLIANCTVCELNIACYQIKCRDYREAIALINDKKENIRALNLDCIIIYTNNEIVDIRDLIECKEEIIVVEMCSMGIRIPARFI